MNRILLILAALGVTATATATAVQAQAHERGGAVRDRLAAIDANRDGAIARAEVQAFREAMFACLDTNQDGYVTREEREAARREHRAREQRGPDADGDGRISRGEFMSQPYRGFDRLDSNDNGVVSAAEIEAVRRR